jgi:hypothetical protein
MGLHHAFRLSSLVLLAIVAGCDVEWPDINIGVCPQVDNCPAGIEVGDDGCARCVGNIDCRGDGCVDSCGDITCPSNSTCDDYGSGPFCVVNNECETDDECGDGGYCEVTCGQDPNCPMCDVCMAVGTCVYPIVIVPNCISKRRRWCSRLHPTGQLHRS